MDFDIEINDVRVRLQDFTKETAIRKICLAELRHISSRFG